MKTKKGFTLMEILIATSILLVGIVGVISLFPVAIKIGGEAVGDSLAANLARSVEEAIRASVKQRKVTYTVRGEQDEVLGYFIYDHDGVYAPDEYGPEKVRKDPVPADPRLVYRATESARLRAGMPGGNPWGLDSVILFPCDNSSRAEAGIGYKGSDQLGARATAYRRGKVFVYPEGDPEESAGTGSGSPLCPANGRGNPRRADDDKDDYRRDHTNRNAAEAMEEKLLPDEEWPLRVTRTYRFGSKVLGASEKTREGTLYKLKENEEDPYKSYSYAFAIRRAYEDPNLTTRTRTYVPANKLFEVKVMIFKGFRKDTTHAEPVNTWTFLISR